MTRQEEQYCTWQITLMLLVGFEEEKERAEIFNRQKQVEQRPGNTHLETFGNLFVGVENLS